MHAQPGLSAQYGSTLATANYTGYLAGALLGIFLPALVRSAAALRASLIVLVVTLALMGATEDHAAWFALRLTAGVASALVFMIAVSTLPGAGRPAAVPAGGRAADHRVQRRPDPRPARRDPAAPQRLPRRTAGRGGGLAGGRARGRDSAHRRPGTQGRPR
jgi:hypothetical protein